jgi:hypothetical protein
MVKKLFVLASVTALSGFAAALSVSGCSSDDPPAGAAPPTPDAGIPDVRPKPPEPPPDGPDDVPQTCPTTTPVTSADIGLTWVAPGPVQTVCNQQNLDDLKALFDKGKGSAKYSEIETTLGTTCAPCVFTQVKSASWGVIVKDGATIVADNSSGSCFGQLSDAACGKAVFELDACVDHVCPQDECTDTQACTSKALKGACKNLLATFQKGCPNAAAIQPQCDNFIKIIAVSCAGGPDAGVDASL